MIRPKKIVICPVCDGEGEVKVGNLREMHNHDTEKCEMCGGTGKMKRIIITQYEKL